MNLYLDSLKGKRVAIVGNQTSTIGKTHLVDTLLSLGVVIKKVFSPEHGFRGDADAGDEDGGHRDEGDGGAAGLKLAAEGGAFVFAEEFFHALEGDGVHVPSVAGDVGDVAEVAVVGGVEPVIHAGAQAEGDVAAAFVFCRFVTVSEQFRHRVGEPFGLKDALPLHDSALTHNRIAGTGEHAGGRVHGASARLQLPGEAVVDAGEVGFLGIAQVEHGEEFPRPERNVADEGLLDFAEPAHEAGHEQARDAVGEEEVKVLLLEDAVAETFGAHGCGWDGVGNGRADFRIRN